MQANTDVWARLRGSFAMPDCDADPAIDTWARRYTQSPERFQAQMQTLLPRLVLVQDSAARHGVPGEFALLPWVESHFQSSPPRKNLPAGMWQIVPSTARHMGLTIDRGYDGRLDLSASTDAVMTTLGHYHDWFQDWRLADYAYNAGRYGIDRLLAREGAPPPEPAVPALPVKAGTRQHLVKLLAIACVVRDPERFHVTLPALDEERRLVTVPIKQRLTLKAAARQAGMPLSALAELNAGYRNGVVSGRSGDLLLLPRGHAEQLRTAQLAQAAEDDGHRVASLDATPALPAVDDDSTSKPRADPPASSAAGPEPRVHVVHQGDTLFEIAHRYKVDVAQLKRWNHLRSKTLRVGQKLIVSAPD